MTQLAPADFRTVGPSEAFPDELVTACYLDDRNLRVAIARINGELHAFDDLCTCADERCPLSGGLLDDTTVMCQCHGSRYDITTGAVTTGPATQPLTTYEVREVEHRVEIRA